MKCPECFSEFLLERITFCPECGFDLRADKLKPPKKEINATSSQKPNRSIPALVVVVAVILLAMFLSDLFPPVVLIGLIFSYFIPSVIAYYRLHPSCDSIFVVNAFLGWTFLGWVGALRELHIQVQEFSGVDEVFFHVERAILSVRLSRQISGSDIALVGWKWRYNNARTRF